MKTLIKTSLFLSLAISSHFANADVAIVAPEIGIDSAALGIGLLTGFVALISERRRK
jgi:hypothetical protein